MCRSVAMLMDFTRSSGGGNVYEESWSVLVVNFELPIESKQLECMKVLVS